MHLTRRFIIITTIIISGMSFFPGILPAQEDTTIKVKVEVVGDLNVDTEVNTYVKGAFDFFPDVLLVEDDPHVYIHIIARKLITNRGRKLGYVLASATAEIFDIVLDSGHPYTFGDYNGLWLEMGPDLKTLCEQCVLAANAGVLDRIREDMAALQQQ